MSWQAHPAFCSNESRPPLAHIGCHDNCRAESEPLGLFLYMLLFAGTIKIGLLWLVLLARFQNFAVQVWPYHTQNVCKTPNSSCWFDQAITFAKYTRDTRQATSESKAVKQ